MQYVSHHRNGNSISANYVSRNIKLQYVGKEKVNLWIKYELNLWIKIGFIKPQKNNCRIWDQAFICLQYEAKTS